MAIFKYRGERSNFKHILLFLWILALPPFRIFTNMADRRCNFKPNLLF
jgi:hypothetical protein